MATFVTCFACLLPLAAQSVFSFQDLAQELASKIVAAVGSADRVTLTTVPAAETDLAALLPIEAAIRQALAARGVRLIEQAGTTTALQVGCATNLRERACVVEIRREATRELVIATRPLEPHDERAIAPALELVPIFSQRLAILDVALFDTRLLVLDPERITLYEQTVDRTAVAPPAPEAAAHSGERTRDAPADRIDRDVERGRWRQIQSRPIAASRPWPRDIRGRLHRDGASVTVWLPGVTCRGSADLSRFACAEDRGAAWPIDIENTGIDAARNFFYTPEGLPFYGAAALGADGDSRWLVVSATGELLFLDSARRTDGSGVAADDVVALDASCASAAHVIVASSMPGENRRDVLRLDRVAKRQLIPVAAPIDVPGRLTALWSTAGSAVATAVVQDMSGQRYEAFHIRVGCLE